MDRWLSRELLFACMAFGGSCVLVYLQAVTSGDWAIVCGAVVAAYLGGQAYVDRPSK